MKKSLLTILLACASPAFASEFFVSPEGSDSGSGSESAPFENLSRAMEAVRDWRSSGGKGTVSVILRGGRHHLDETLVLGIDDGATGISGQTENRVGAQELLSPHLVFRAYPGETPVLTSAIPLSGWKRLDPLPANFPEEAKGNVWTTKLPQGIKSFFTLYDDQGLLPRARGNGFVPTKKGDLRTLHFPNGALKDWPNLNDVEIFVRPTNPWTVNMLPLDSVDVENGVAETGITATYAMGPLRKGTHDHFGVSVWVENVPDVLDQPGEWVLDSKSGRLYLWPRSTDPDGSPSGVRAPTLTELIRVEGQINYDGPVDQAVRGIAFEGLTFTEADRRGWLSQEDRLGWGLQHDWEMFDRPTALLRFRGAEGCLVRNCRFENSGGTGVRFDLHAQRNRIVDNHFAHLGEAGILLAGYGPGTKDANRNNDIVNNHLHHVGEIMWHAPAIWAWQSGYNRIAHNLIHDCPYSAILLTCRVKPEEGPHEQGGRTIRKQEIAPEAFDAGKTYAGWVAREPYQHARHNLVEFNDISRSVQKLSDGNGIYVSGAGTANLIRYNFLHDHVTETVTETIRCDDDQHNTLVYGNICEGSAGLSVLSSKGINYFVNNYVVKPVGDFNRAIVSYERYKVSGSVLRNNVIVAGSEGGTLCKYTKVRADSFEMLATTNMDHNLYYSPYDAAWATPHLEKMRSGGLEMGSIFADPDFFDYTQGDYRLLNSSPARDLGIESLNKERMGLLGENSSSNSELDMNYCSGQLQLSLPEGEHGSLEIKDLWGNEIAKRVISSSQKIDVSAMNFERGWYFAELQWSGEESRTQFFLSSDNP